MKMAEVATIDSFLESIVGISKVKRPAVTAQSAVTVATKTRILIEVPMTFSSSPPLMKMLEGPALSGPRVRRVTAVTRATLHQEPHFHGSTAGFESSGHGYFG